MLRRCMLLLGAVLCAAPLHAQTKSSDELPDSLLFPVPGIDIEKLTDTFSDKRSNSRVHHALDIPAPRHTPVLSVDSGRVIKLHRSKDGGISIYATDVGEHFIYFYAHLQSYAPDLKEGQILARGDTIGYVGTTGNAPPNLPHLHFGIYRSNDITKWSKGVPVNPFEVFRR